MRTEGYLLPDEVLKNGTFSCALTTYHCDLWQIKLHVHPELRECILEFVHDWNQLFHTRVPCHFVEAIRSMTQEHYRFWFHGCVLWATPSCHHFHAQPSRVTARGDPIRFRETTHYQNGRLFAKAHRTLHRISPHFPKRRGSRTGSQTNDVSRWPTARKVTRRTYPHNRCVHINEIQHTNSRHVTFQSIIEACAQALSL